MDSTAFSLCMDNGMPILVFDLQQKTFYSNGSCWRKDWYYRKIITFDQSSYTTQPYP